MDFIELIRTIADVGVLVCIAALFIYAVYRWINNYFDNKDDTKGGGVPGKKDRDRHDELILLRTKISKDIQQLISTTLDDMGWERIHIVEFSNSMMSVAYLPFRYMTCTYEVFCLGKTGTGSKIDRLSTSLFTSFFTKLHDNGWCLMDLDKPETAACGAMKDLMVSNGETKSLSAGIVSPKGKSLGYVSVKNEKGFSEEDIEAILTLADQVAVLLGVVDK